MFRILAAALAVSAFVPTIALAHGGGLNAQGCHNNRRTGDYHCHGGGRGPPPAYRAPQTAYGGSSAGQSTSRAAFANCAAARAAGAAPVRRGEPGYGAHLDRDNDGIGCE